MNSEVTSIGIGVETDAVERGIKVLKSLSDQGPKVEKAMDGISNAASKANASMGRLGSDTAGLSAVSKAAEEAAKKLGWYRDAQGRLRDESGRFVSAARQMEAGLAGVTRQASQTATGTTNSFARISSGANSAAEAIGSIARMAAGLGGALSLASIAGNVTRVQREFDVMNASLITVTGSAAAAAKEFVWLQEFARETPFGLKQATEAFVKMKSLGLDPTKESLTSFGNTASAMGKSLEQMIEAVADASTSEFERLKEFGIKASQSGQTVAMTFQGVTKNIGNNAQEIVEYLNAIGEHQFAGAMAERAKTLDGAISELEDTWNSLYLTISQQGTGGLIHDSVRLAITAVDDLNTILKALDQTSKDGAQSTGALATIQEGLAIVFETVAVVGLTVKDTLVGVGREIGAIAAQAAALARLDFQGFAAIGEAAKEDAENARAEWEAAVNAILTARQRVGDAPPLINPGDAAAAQQTTVDLNSVATAALNATSSFKSKAEQMAEVRAQGDRLRGALKQLEEGGKGASKEAEALRERLKGVDERMRAMQGAGGGANALKQQEVLYKTLTKSISEKIAAQRQELAFGTRLTDIDKLRIRVEQEMTGARKAGLLAMLDIGKAQERELEARAAFLDLAEAEKKARMELAASAEKEAEGFAEANQRLREEIELIGLSEEAQHAINQARLQAQITVKEQHLAELQRANDVHDFMSREQIALEEQIRLLKERLGLMDDKRVRDANAKAQDRLEKEWDRTAQTIGDTLADYIMSGGKDAATYLKRLFSTLVLQPVVQTVVGGVMGTGAAAASGAGAGMMDRLANSGGGLTNWSTWGISSSDWLMTQSTKLGLDGWNSMSDAAYNLGETIQGVDNWLKDTAGIEGGIGQAFGYAQAIYALTEGNYGQAIGTAIGTYILPGIGTMIGSTLGGMVDGMFGGGTPHGGAAAGYSGGQITDFGKGFTRKQINSDYTSGMQAGVSAVAATVGQSFDALAALFDRQAGYRVTTGFSADSDDPAWGRLQIYDAVGEALVDWNAGRYGPKDTRLKSQFSSDPEKAFDQYLQSVAASSLPALKDIAPAWADAMIDGATKAIGFDGSSWKSITVSGQEAVTAMQSVVQQIALTEAGFASLGNVMSMFSGISDDMKTSLLGAAGSIENLTGIASSYYNSSLFSEDERMQAAAKQINAALSDAGIFAERGGLDVLADGSKEKLKQAVNELMEAGQGAMAVQLMAMGESFAQIADWGAKSAQAGAEAAQEAAEAAQEAAEAAQEAARAAAQAVADAVGNAWGNLGTMSGLAAQYTGNTSGLTAQLGTVKASYAGATDTSGRVAALQQIIGLEQSIWNAQQAARQAEQQAAQKRAEAAREQLQSVNQLLSAAKGLGDYASKLFMSEQSGLSDAERLAALGSEYSSLMARAKTGDADALQDLQGVSSDYLRLAEQMSASQADYSVLSGTIAAELASAAAIQEASATSQTARLERQIEAAERAAEFASAQFQVSSDTQKLIDSLLAESMLGFATEAQQMAQLITSGQMTVEGIDSLPAELAGLLNATLVPAISGIADAARAAATAAQSSASMASAAIARAMASSVVQVPGFASGGFHSGGLRLVGERGPELEVTGPARYFDSNTTARMLGGGMQQSSNAELIAEIKALRTEVAALRSPMERTAAATTHHAELFDNVSAGGDKLLVETRGAV